MVTLWYSEMTLGDSGVNGFQLATKLLLQENPLYITFFDDFMFETNKYRIGNNNMRSYVIY